MDLGDYTGQGGGFSTADQSMAASGTTGSVDSGFSGPSYDSNAGGDNYSNYVAASQPRTGIAAIKDFFTGDKYDYGYQRTLGNTFGGLGTLLLGAINPVLGLAARGYQAFKPEFNTFKNSPTIESYLNNRRNLYAPDTMPNIDNRLLDYYESIYSKPEGIQTIPTTTTFDNPFNTDNLYAQAPEYPTSGYGVRDEEKRNALEQFYQENPELKPQENSLLYNGIGTLV